MAKKAVQVEETKSKIQQRREELQAQLDVLEVLQDVEDELNDLIDRYQRFADDECVTSVEDGYESEQAKDSDGNLLFTVDDAWHKYTQKEIDEKGLTGEIKPYYRTKYRQEKRKPEDLDSWSKSRYLKYIKLVELLKKVEVI